VRTEKKTFFSSLGTTRSAGVSQGRAWARVPARAVFARVGWLSAPRIGRSEAQSLDGHRSGGYGASQGSRVSRPCSRGMGQRGKSRHAATLCFQHVYARRPRSCHKATPIR
jgi:hypothetical protein